MQQRKLILQRNGRCFLCIKTGHRIKECQSPHKCRNCQQSHHQSICQKSVAGGEKLNSLESTSGNTPRVVQLTIELPKVKDGEKTGEQMERTRTATVRGKAHTKVLLQIATLSAVNESNRKTAPVRVLFDSGSQRTWTRNEIKEKLGLKPIKRQIVNLNTFGNESCKKQTCDVVKVWLTGKNNA